MSKDTFILQNEVQCRKCRSIIWSGTRHDYKSCACKSVAVDGGQEYIRRTFERPTDYIERSLTVSNRDAFLRLVDVVKFMDKFDMGDEQLALLVCFAYHRSHDLFHWKYQPETFKIECLNEIKTMRATGRNALGLVLGMIRVLRAHQMLDSDLFEEGDGVHPEEL